ncbi:MAG: hypothetical protein KJ950_12025 [Proteobacteria bacterium]|nr:hypothetical protein [Pseudomonadota bacterium]MBU1688059.1 hypothetical protein [Pseudomonadota bacterium]
MGGLSKKASLFSQQQGTSEDTLILDGGGLLFDSPRITVHKIKQAEINAQGIIKAYNLIGYDAVGITGQDLAAGYDFLNKIKKESNFAWLSANLYLKDSVLPLFQPFLSKMIGNQAITIIGLTGPGLDGDRQLEEKIVIRPWQEILPDLLNTSKIKNTFIILLTDLDRKSCQEITELYPSINLIIQAANQDENISPVPLNETTLLTSTGRKGKFTGLLSISWINGGRWDGRLTAELSRKKIARDRVDLLIDQYTGNPEKTELIKKLQEKRTILSAELAQLELKTSQLEQASYSIKFSAIESTLPDAPDVSQIVEETKRQVNRTGQDEGINRQSPDRSKIISSSFIGWKVCGSCHSAQVASWQTTPHFASFAGLTDTEQQFNRNCIPCHVTGVFSGSEEYALELPEELQLVGCEACHGPGRKHQMDPKGNPTIPPDQVLCLRCHNPENDDSFDFVRDKAKVHP